MYDHFLIAQRAAELLGTPTDIKAYTHEGTHHIVIEGTENGFKFYISVEKKEDSNV